MGKRISCVDRLRELREDMHIRKKDIKRYSTLPVINIKVSKKDKRQAKKQEKQVRYELANWYLNEYLTKRSREKLYLKFDNLDELVNHCSQMAIQVQRMLVFTEDRFIDPEELLPDLPLHETDIPSTQWKEYGEYLKKHKLKSVGDIKKTRFTFQKKVKKKRKKYYKNGLMIYDPLFKNCQLNEKRMIENLHRISEENEIRCQEFHDMMQKLVGDDKDHEMIKRFDERTKAIQSRVRTHIKDLQETSLPLPFYIDE